MQPKKKKNGKTHLNICKIIGEVSVFLKKIIGEVFQSARVHIVVSFFFGKKLIDVIKVGAFTKPHQNHP